MEAAALALELGEGAGNSEEESYIAPFIRARVLNFGTVLPFKSLKANCYGK